MKYLGDFITYALADDHEKRLRVAEYFATLTISPELQEKWKDYRNGIIKTMNDLEAKKIELAAAQKEGGKGENKVRKLEAEVVRQNYTKNEFEVQKDGKVIYDKTTGLMWQQSGSEKHMIYDEAHNYIRQLNQKGFADYSDWRLPTLKEAITLLKPGKTDKDLYIASLFDNEQKWIWTSDLSSAASAWVVHFIIGSCHRYYLHLSYSVRAVR